MKNVALGVVGLVFVGTLIWGTTRQGAADTVETGAAPISVSAVAPLAAPGTSVAFLKDPATIEPLDVTLLDGSTLTVGRGKVTIVNFWATWCPPCRAEVPDLVALQAKYPDQLQIIGISEDEEGPDVVRQFVSEFKINYAVAMSSDRIREVFPGIGALPTSFIIDKDGRVMQKHIGMLSAGLTELETRALAGLEPDLHVQLVEPAKPIGLENEAQVREIPGVDLASLAPAKRTEALRRLNTEGCTCGCGLTVARCRVDDPTCGVSLPIARRIVAEIAAQ